MATGHGDLADRADDVLADRARDGDAGAFETLLRRHEPAVRALALRITGNAADADDALQVAFVSAWRALPRFRGDCAFGTWLHRIVANRSTSLVRGRRPAVPLPEADDRHPAADHARGPAACAERAAFTGAVTDALAALPADQRAVWLLREVEHRSYDEVAVLVGESASTVRGRLARARRTLAGSMAQWR
ncbi:RNA polymerase sigma factor [Jatrophihabitans fulvus]